MAGIPLDWTPPDVSWLPDVMLVEVLNDGTELNFDNEELSKFSRDIHEMAETIIENAGLD